MFLLALLSVKFLSCYQFIIQVSDIVIIVICHFHCLKFICSDTILQTYSEQRKYIYMVCNHSNLALFVIFHWKFNLCLEDLWEIWLDISDIYCNVNWQIICKVPDWNSVFTVLFPVSFSPQSFLSCRRIKNPIWHLSILKLQIASEFDKLEHSRTGNFVGVVLPDEVPSFNI